ncbi:MAG TPA: glycoside hydrolase family 15 protein [Solirubrobacteraceae bacterium]|nr:glycoside hydrolase family 15 protein [Solirubrobacteraceae bacterium]
MSEDEIPPISDYALIGDCHSAALVSRSGSIDWCCLPRFDSGSSFGRLLDPERGGHCSVALRDGRSVASSYLEETLVLRTAFESSQGSAEVIDFFAMREHGARSPRRELVRIVECTRGTAELALDIAPRFDYGAVRPWLRRTGIETFAAIGGDDGLLVWSDHELESDGESLRVGGAVHAGERLRLLIRYERPELLEDDPSPALEPEQIDGRLDETLAWWRRWRQRIRNDDGGDRGAVVRSMITLKALTYAPTGAIVAAATTSLPETIGGERNWDYRYSWIRDSTLAAHALAELGCEREAERFRHFIVRSSAGHAEDLQILFGVGGERRMTEEQLDLAGYRGSRPVRIGNGAAVQLQLDSLGEILNLAWRWHKRGHSPDDDEWRFFAEVVDAAAERWSEPDHGIWEWPGEPQHFVHSKACCWAALERGLTLAGECARKAPVRRWERARREIAQAIDEHGYDRERGVFVQCFDEPDLDAALLLLPIAGFVEFDDERMVRTTDAIRSELDANGFLYRYRRKDGLPGQEGAFLACSFWLAECLARQGRLGPAREVFDRAVGASGPLGLFSEQVDPKRGELLGNYPQTLTHLSHVAAAVALAESQPQQAAASV